MYWNVWELMNPTKAEKKYWNKLCDLGCIACRTYLGKRNDYVSIHHINGRTKPNCHKDVLPLCFEHHQGREGIHFMSRKVWEQKYGKQEDLKKLCNKLLEDI